MYKKNQEHCEGKIVLLAISAAALVGSLVFGSQLVQSSTAQDLEQAGQQAEIEAGGVEQLAGGNQTGNQSGNQSG